MIPPISEDIIIIVLNITINFWDLHHEYPHPLYPEL